MPRRYTRRFTPTQHCVETSVYYVYAEYWVRQFGLTEKRVFDGTMEIPFQMSREDIKRLILGVDIEDCVRFDAVYEKVS